MTYETENALIASAFNLVRRISETLVSIGVILGIVFYLVEPLIKDYLAKQNEELRQIVEYNIESTNRNVNAIQSQNLNVTNLTEQVADLVKLIESNSTHAFIQFEGVPHEISSGPYNAGDKVSFLYAVSRKIGCKTEVQNIWLNVDTRTVYQGESFIAIQAALSSRYVDFVAAPQIPEDAPKGRYVYWPILDALDCGIYDTHVRPPWTTIIDVV